MTTPGTASTTDARKRQADRETSGQPPQFPDATGWVKRAPGDVIEAGTPYVSFGEHEEEWRVTHGTTLTPPPAPREPWCAISTDRDKPTLAKVTLDLENHRWPRPGEWYVDNLTIFCRWSDDWQPLAHASHVTDVEVLHTHNPVTHVPVDRSLADVLIAAGWTKETT